MIITAKQMLLGTVMTLLLMSPVYAQLSETIFTYEHCVNNRTLQHIRTVTINVSERQDISRTFNVTENENCPHGCFEDECRSSPWQMILIIFGILLTVSILWVFIRAIR
jgi:hypothetical protein